MQISADFTVFEHFHVHTMNTIDVIRYVRNYQNYDSDIGKEFSKV